MIKLRNAKPEDIEKICEFKRKGVSLNFPSCPFNENMFRRNMLRHMEYDPNYVKVAELEGEVAGYIWFRMVNSTVGVFGRIEHIFVDEKFRHHGLGKKLMSVAEAYLRDNGVKKIKLTVTMNNDEALSLYKKIGYKTNRFVMEKDL
jgi:ribosomal protein S18 acetylase RimI-like enzyme